MSDETWQEIEAAREIAALYENARSLPHGSTNKTSRRSNGLWRASFPRGWACWPPRRRSASRGW